MRYCGLSWPGGPTWFAEIEQLSLQCHNANILYGTRWEIHTRTTQAQDEEQLDRILYNAMLKTDFQTVLSLVSFGSGTSRSGVRDGPRNPHDSDLAPIEHFALQLIYGSWSVFKM